MPLFCEKAGIQYNDNMKNNYTINTIHITGNIWENYVAGYNSEITNALNKCLYDCLNEIMSHLEYIYDFFLKDEDIIRRLKMDSYLFLEDGDLFV